MKQRFLCVMVAIFMALAWSIGLGTQHASAANILIHMKTSLALDDAQICAVPNVAWAAVKAGHMVTILVDASAVTSVTKGFGFFRRLLGSDSTRSRTAAGPRT